MKLDNQVYLLGIRHHGPGCASSLKRVLAELQPDAILLEGAAELQDSWHLAGDPAMSPPVAQVIYDPVDPAQAMYYPWGEFSPEWQAMRYAAASETPLLMMDLPIGIELTLREQQTQAAEETDADTDEDEANDPPEDTPLSPPPVASPFDRLAQAAGYDDGEHWWDITVEHQSSDLSVFEAIAEAMQAVRSAEDVQLNKREALREAWMRKILRQARKSHPRIAVVCGAWHVPALAANTRVKDDNALLKGLKRKKTAVAWIPYLYARFQYASGYGAGIHSPGWYEQLFRHHQRHQPPQELAIGWQTRVARLLRQQGFDCSSAQVIDAVRLAQGLADLRELPIPGLAEMQDAARGALTDGHNQPLELIERELIVGTRLGTLPDHIPQLPLEQNLATLCKKLRLKREPESRDLKLDLRKPSALARSVLLHRLNILNLPWGVIQESAGLGSFKEDWSLRWEPEYAVSLIDASRYGNTIEQAASRCCSEQLDTLDSVAALANRLETIRQADLANVLPQAIQRLQNLAAVSADLPDLMHALLHLVQELRYGSVRATSGEALQGLVDQLVIRVCNGLASACLQLDEDAAYAMIAAVDKSHAAIAAINDAGARSRWVAALRRVTQHEHCPPLLIGRCTRLLYDLGELDLDHLRRTFRLATSAANDVTDAAAWLEGLLYQGAVLLLHDETFFRQLDDWLQALAEDDFMHILPLLRRTMTTFSAQELRQLGDRVRHGNDRRTNSKQIHDPQLAADAMQAIARLLGLQEPTA